MVWKNKVSNWPWACRASTHGGRLDALGGLVVQRSKLCQFVDLGDDIVIDEHGAIEVLAALHYAVPHGVDVVQRVDGLGGAARPTSNTRAMAAL